MPTSSVTFHCITLSWKFLYFHILSRFLLYITCMRVGLKIMCLYTL